MSLFQDPTAEERQAALAHVALAEKQAAHLPNFPDNLPLRPIASTAVIGAGTMGCGIAMAMANIGLPCALIDTQERALARGLEQIARQYQSSASRGKLTAEEAQARIALITGSTQLEAVAGADLVVEAVPERMDLKTAVFGQLDRLCKPGAILSTNTSGLNIDKIALSTSRPGDVIGAHFFAPANVMRLLEVVQGERTSPDVVATLMALGRRMGKVAVLSTVSPGFIGNAMMAHYMRESIFLVEEGATPRRVDEAMTGFGFAMGLFTVGDMAGNDVGIDNARAERATRDPSLRYPDLRIALCDHGRLGQKSGAGWYKYTPGDRTPQDDPELERIVEAYRAQHGLQRRTISKDEILERCLLGLINEGALLLEKRVALRASDIDIVYVTGYGFPAYRGGPMYMADQIGLDRIVERLEAYRTPATPWWEPAPLLRKLAASGAKFGSA